MFSEYQTPFLYSSFFIVSLVFSVLINRLFLKFSKNLGMRNVDESIVRWETKSKPAFGGISFYIIFLLSISVYSIFSPDKSIFHKQQFLGLLLSTSLGFIVGLADDAYNTRPYLKFSAQLICGIILIATGTYITLFDNIYLNYLLTLLWVVGIMNSINMLDNMDAITSLVSVFIIICALFVVYFIGKVDTINFLILTGVLSSILGFLFYNWHPSKIYMGDTGSQFLGVLLSAMGIIYFWNTPFNEGFLSPSKQLLLTAIIFIIPIVDTTTVVINRLAKGKSPFVGGRDHTTHHLSYMGLSDRKVALLLGGIALLSFFMCIYIVTSANWTNANVLFFGLYFLTIFALLYSTTQKNKPQEKSK